MGVPDPSTLIPGVKLSPPPANVNLTSPVIPPAFYDALKPPPVTPSGSAFVPTGVTVEPPQNAEQRQYGGRPSHEAASPSPVAGSFAQPSPIIPNTASSGLNTVRGLGDAPSAVASILAQPDQAFDAFWQQMVPPESGGKNVPNYRYDATHTASGTAQLTDTNWLRIAPRLGINTKDYPTAMSAPPDWQKAVTKLLFRMEGQTPWDQAHGGPLPVNPHAAAETYWQGQVADIQRGYQERYEKNSKNLQKAIEQLNNDSDVAKAMKDIDAARKQADEALAAYKGAIAQQPKAPVLDGVQHLNSIGVIVGLLGGLFTKAPMLASTNAAAAAIEAYNAGDMRAYNIAHDNWKNQTDLLFKIADMNATRVRDIITEDKIPIEERRAKLTAFLNMVGLQDLAEQTKLQGMEIGLKYWQENERLKNERERVLEERDKGVPVQKPDGSWVLWKPLSNKELPMPGTPQSAVTRARQDLTPDDRQQVERDLQAWLATPEGQAASQTEIENKRYELGNEVLRKKAQLKQKPPSGAMADENAYTDAYVADKIANLGHTPSKQEIAQLRIEGRAEAKNTLRGTGVISDDAANVMAEQMILGDTRGITSLPRAGASRIKVENRFAELLRERDAGARDVVMNRLRMLEAESAARTAGRVTMQTEIFAKEATDAGAEVVRTSKLVPRTDQPMFNRALEAFYRQEGDPNIIAFGAALSAFINAYGKMSNPTGTGVHDADKERIQQAIDQSLSQGQIEAGVNQVVTEGVIISNAARTAQQQVLQGLAPTGIGAGGGAPRTQLPTVTNQAEYDALQPNTPYQDAQGNRYTKGK